MACAEPNDAIHRSHSLSVVSRTTITTRRRNIATLIAGVFLAGLPMTARPASAVIGGTGALGNTAVVRLVNGSSVCSGALWTSRIVVTAAHCVVTTAGTLTTRPIFVFAPGVNVQQSPQTVSQSAIITVDGWVRRGEFSQPDDIAFVVLDSELPGASISRLATTNEVAAWSRDERLVTFLGYGRTSPSGAPSSTPNAIDQRLIPFPTWPGSFAAQQTQTTGICSGDSGGPVVTLVGDELVLLGISSAASGPCATSNRPSMTGFVASAFPDLVRRALELTTSLAAPAVTTEPATGITGTSATLNATAIGNNLPTTVSFSYGLQPDLSGPVVTLEASQVTGTEPKAVQLVVTGLVPGSTYYFRANASSAVGLVSGAIVSFFTLGGAPVVQSGTVREVSSDSAVLTGVVNANSVRTQVYFQYSRTPDFGAIDGTIVAGDVSGNETASFSVELGRLEPDTIYFWRIAATNEAATSVGATQSFTTPVFTRGGSLAPRALLSALSIDRNGVFRAEAAPVARSRTPCTVNSRNKRVVFTKTGTCRIRVSFTRGGERFVGVYNLVVR